MRAILTRTQHGMVTKKHLTLYLFLLCGFYMWFLKLTTLMLLLSCPNAALGDEYFDLWITLNFGLKLKTGEQRMLKSQRTWQFATTDFLLLLTMVYPEVWFLLQKLRGGNGFVYTTLPHMALCSAWRLLLSIL